MSEPIRLPSFTVERNALGLVELRCNGTLIGSSQDALSDEEFPRLRLVAHRAHGVTRAAVFQAHKVIVDFTGDL